MNHNVVFCFHTNDHEYNLGVGFLSSCLKKNDIAVDLVVFREIAGKQHDNAEEIAARIASKSPTVVGFSVMTIGWSRIQQVIRLLRPQFQGLIVVGGYHAILSTETVIQEPGVDVVCLGEGERPLLDLLRQYDHIEKRGFTSIEGLVFTGHPQLPGQSSKGWLLNNLEDYPYIDYELFDDEGDKKLSQKTTGMLSPAGVFSISVTTGRGCPYKCTYCSNSALIDLYGGPKQYVRKYSVDASITNIKAVVERFKPQFIEFLDETLTMQKKWVLEFCRRYKEEISVPFSIMTRIDRLDEETIEILADSGLKLVFVGIECGDEDYRIKYLRRKMSNSAIVKGAALLKKHGVMFFTFNIMGMPFETKDTIAKTFELNEEIKPDAAISFFYVPFPGTEMAKLAYENNFVIPMPEGQWDFCNATVDSPSLPSSYVQEMVQRFRSIYTCPSVVERVFQKIRDTARPAFPSC